MRYVGKAAAILLINFIVILCSVAAFSQVPLTVTSVSPPDGAVDVSVYEGEVVHFSADLNKATVTNDSFFLTDPVGNKLPTIAFHVDDRYAALNAGQLDAGVTYTIHVTTAVQDVVGNSLASEFTSSFTTALPQGPLTVTSVNPPDGAVDVSVYEGEVVHFSADLNKATVTNDSFFLTDPVGNKLPTIAFHVDDRYAALNASPLDSGVTYTIHVTTAVQDVVGNSLASEFTSSFTTAFPQVPLTVTSVNPPDGAVDVSVYEGEVVHFSADLNKATVTNDSFFLTDPVGNKLPTIAFHVDDRYAALNAGQLDAGVTYTIHVTTAVQDVVGNSLASEFTSSFTTALPQGPLTVTSVNPPDGAVDVSVYEGEVVHFSADLNKATVTNDSFFLTDPVGNKLPTIAFHVDDRYAALNASPLDSGVTYTIHVTTAVQDVVGNSLASEFTSSFTTAGLPEPSPPAADAGPDQDVDADSACTADVTLDGSGSTDPDDDIVSFEWYENGTPIGSGETLDYTFSLGVHTVTLVVTDSFGETDTDEVVITVQDTSPPDISLSVGKDSLWPPNHKMVDVGFSYSVSDNCDENLNVSITVTSDEPTATAPGAGGSKHAPDADIADNQGVYLRAERSGKGDGRVYMVTVEATDDPSNQSAATVPVKVNVNRKTEAVDSGQNYDATGIN